MVQSGQDELVAASRPDEVAVGEIELVARHIDSGFYADGDAIRAARHYCATGWREGRDPTDWFKTDAYLRANPDVRDAGINPFWHYLVQGRQEGRPPDPAAETPPASAAPARRGRALVRNPTVLSAGLLHTLLREAVGPASGLVVAFGEADPQEPRDAAALLVADEQRKFSGDCAAYLYLSPTERRAGLSPTSPDPHWLAVTLDARPLGVTTAGAVAVALASLPGPLRSLLVVHSLSGQRPEALRDIAAALRPQHAFFHVTDYSAACAGWRLLRNDAAFCHAPPPDSMACRVCRHGSDRPAHLARVAALFRDVPFHVVAPSHTALETWRRATDLPAQSTRVHRPMLVGPSPVGAAAAAAPPGPVRVAFVGPATAQTGWDVFAGLVVATAASDRYEFIHVARAAETSATPDVRFVYSEAHATRPFGLTRLLADLHIDLVLALSPWPEPYADVTYAALAAGADVVTTPLGGDAAEVLRATGRGLVLRDMAALMACFTGQAASRHALARRAAPRPPPSLRHVGSIATLSFLPASESLPVTITADPDLHVVIDGERFDGERMRDTWRFALPLPRRHGRTYGVRLRSRRMDQIWEVPNGADARRLGVAVSHLWLDGQPIPAGHAARAAGWHAPEAAWQWTDGDATLRVGRARTLDVTVVPLAQYWLAPLLSG